MEESTKEKIQGDDKNGGVSDEEDSSQRRSKHSKKHKHKHAKKHKHKHKKRKHKRKSSSRSRSRSSSRSRSKSPDTINSDNDSSSNLDAYDVGSFKLEKSVSRSPSPNPKGEPKKNGDKGMSKSPFCLKDNNKNDIKDGSESPPFYTEQDLLERDGKLPICKSLVTAENAVDNSDTKISLEPQSETKPSTANEDNSKPNTAHTIDGAGSENLASRKSKSKSPMDSKKRSRSKSLSRSLSPKSRKRKSASRSKSRSKSPKRKHSRKSRSRSRSYEKRKSRRKSRSRSLSSRSQSRSPRRNKSKERKRSRSKDRRSRSKDRRRSISRDRKKSRERRRSRSQDRRRSPIRQSRNSSRKGYRDSSCDRRSSRRYSSYRRSRSPSPRRRPSRRSRSPQRRYRGRSRSPQREYRKRSRSKSRSRRSRSRSYSSRRRKSRSRSRSKSRERSNKRSNSKSPDSNSDKKSSTTTETPSITTATAKDLVGKAPTITDPSNKKSLAMLTEFCKKLTEARGISENDDKEDEENETKEEEEEEESSISHPFLVAPKKDITIPQVIFPVKPILPPVNMIDSSKPLTEQFPVSCGTKHHEKESEDTSLATIPDVNGSAAQQQPQPVFQQPQLQEKLDISSLVVKRMDAQRRLQANPNDVDAMLALQEIEMKLNNWCQSNVKPGQFTGQLAKQMMPKEKMNSGYQAWAKKDMFHNLNPVSGGVGMKLLQKMGWAPGQVLGRSGKGMVEPIALTVKVDRKGLSSTMERPLGKKGGPIIPNMSNKPQLDLQGKHPISMLQEFCARRKWNVPEFTLIFDEGPPHSKQFLFKVLVNGYEYQNPVVSGNKKHAKAQAAVAALKGLGLVPEDAQF